MKRFLTMFLVLLLVFQAPYATVLANEDVEVQSNSETFSLTPTAYYSFDDTLTEATGTYSEGIPWRKMEEGISEWGGVDDYTFTFSDNGKNQAVHFDGTTGLMLAKDLITKDTYSYSFWLKQDGDIGEYTSAFYAGMGLTRTGISPAIGGVGEIIYQVADDIDEASGLRPQYMFHQLPERYSPMEWNHFFVTVDAGALSLYLNGEKALTMEGVAPIFDARSNEFLLGFNPFPDPYYKGYMDEVMFFNGEAVSEEEVSIYYQLTEPEFNLDSSEDDVPVENPEETEPPTDEETSPELPGEDNEWTKPEFKNVGVHDPSIVIADDTYYVFGSHLASAKSTDLIQWNQMTTEVSSDNPLFEDVFQELEEVFDWAESDTLWAADVIQLEDGRYYMYYNACRGDSPLSAMGIAVSDSIDGPYEDLGIFLWSGKNPNPMGLEYNIDIHPNAVDPAVFYDKEGQLWMVYGSYSGGIFILEMDNETGFPKEPNTYGKKLMGGGVRIEASYMQYIPETDYYYLYTTFGGLDVDGGYNMRISRSKNPDGPFVDIKGQDMIQAIGREGIPFDDEAIEPYGNKLNGNFVFSNLNAANDHPTIGYVSPGHNSSFYEESTGKHFSIFHTRFPNRGEEHEVRVHLMPMNEDGWPVMAPHRYAGESVQKVDKTTIPGTYHFVNHGNQISPEINKTMYMELREDGTIVGEKEGTWKLTGDHYATITVDGETYKGVFIKQYSELEQDFVMAFTAISNNGHSIWGSAFTNVSDEEFVENAINQLHIGATDSVFRDLKLPTKVMRGATLTWESTNETVLAPSGKVTRPESGAGDVVLKLTATIKYNDVSKTKSFDITVKEKSEKIVNDGLVAYYPFDKELNEETGVFGQATVTGANINLQSDETVSFVPGAIDYAAQLNGNNGILLGDGLIKNNDYTVSMWVKPEILQSFATGFFGMTSDTSWSSFLPVSHDGTTMLWSGTNWYDASAGMTIPENRWTHMAYTVRDGEVNIYINGELKFQGENYPDLFTEKDGKFAIGVNPWDTPFTGLVDEVRIYGYSHEKETIKQIMTATKESNVEVSEIQLNTSDKKLVKGSTFQIEANVFPLNATDKSVSYSSSDEGIVTVNQHTGTVTAHQYGTATVTVTAEANNEVFKSFDITVTDGKVAQYDFEGVLHDSLSLSEAGIATGDRISKVGKGQVSYGQGIDNQALVLDGTSGVRLPDGLIQDKTYSVSMWVKPEELTPFTPLFFGAQSDARWVSLVPSGPAENKTMLWSNTGQWYDAPTEGQIPVDEWTHLSFTVKDGDVYIYVNGKAEFVGQNFPDVFESTQGLFSLGVNYWDTPFKGMIDELIVYDGYALTEAEVTKLYEEMTDDPSNPSDPDEDKEEDLEDLEQFDQVKEQDGSVVYINKKPAKKFDFPKTLLEQLNNEDKIEVKFTDGKVKVVFPAILVKKGERVQFTMDDVTEEIRAKVENEYRKIRSAFIHFSLKDGEEELLFNEQGVTLTFKVNQEEVFNWDNIEVIYLDDNGEIITDHDAEILSINKETGEVKVKVKHFSTYGIVEVLDEEIIGHPGNEEESNEDNVQGEDNSGDSITVEENNDDSVDTENDSNEEGDGGQELPDTSIGMYNYLFIGLLLIGTSSVLLYSRKRKNV